MGVQSSSVSDKKPTVNVMVCPPIAGKTLDPILWGLEEEGIPAEVHESSSGSAVSLARQGASMSSLNVGIGINAAEDQVALHHRDLPDEKPLFTLTIKDIQSRHLRTLGVNAARLVKGDPLVFQDEPLFNMQDNQNAGLAHPASEELVELVARVVLELLRRE